mmetsp:Transcript_31723/g.5742  ORF Transcript_31723/g.5742 Transcript_31723/m.5742 type:complete len:148 (-) Transcript_31723:198-641(-)
MLHIWCLLELLMTLAFKQARLLMLSHITMIPSLMLFVMPLFGYFTKKLFIMISLKLFESRWRSSPFSLSEIHLVESIIRHKGIWPLPSWSSCPVLIVVKGVIPYITQVGITLVHITFTVVSPIRSGPRSGIIVRVCRLIRLLGLLER